MTNRIERPAPGLVSIPTGPLYHLYQYLFDFIYKQYVKDSISSLQKSLDNFRRFMPSSLEDRQPQNLYKLLKTLGRASEVEKELSSVSLNVLDINKLDTSETLRDPKLARFVRSWDLLARRLKDSPSFKSRETPNNLESSFF